MRSQQTEVVCWCGSSSDRRVLKARQLQRTTWLFCSPSSHLPRLLPPAARHCTSPRAAAGACTARSPPQSSPGRLQRRRRRRGQRRSPWPQPRLQPRKLAAAMASQQPSPARALPGSHRCSALLGPRRRALPLCTIRSAATRWSSLPVARSHIFWIGGGTRKVMQRGCSAHVYTSFHQHRCRHLISLAMGDAGRSGWTGGEPISRLCGANGSTVSQTGVLSRQSTARRGRGSPRHIGQ
eukprot:COSAG01_NODE_5739_length_4065_cov_2.031266_6_plen_238_part_00